MCFLMDLQPALLALIKNSFLSFPTIQILTEHIEAMEAPLHKEACNLKFCSQLAKSHFPSDFGQSPENKFFIEGGLRCSGHL